MGIILNRSIDVFELDMKRYFVMMGWTRLLEIINLAHHYLQLIISIPICTSIFRIFVAASESLMTSIKRHIGTRRFLYVL